MMVWVKEIPDKFTVGTIRIWIKDEIDVCPYLDETTSFNDYVVLSEEDSDVHINGDARVLIYEDFSEKITQSIIHEINYNYDYYYLRNAIRECKKSNIDTLITGSSYGLYGIKRGIIPSAVNLSMPSKDLYYVIKEIEEVMRDNPGIRNIVLCCSYYYFFSDLSKTQDPGEFSRVSKVYYPIFGDPHNAVFIQPKMNFLIESCIIDTQKIMDLYSYSEYEKAYFYEERPRESTACKEWSDKSKTWQQLEEEERISAGLIRVKKHNKSLKHSGTYSENKILMELLSQYCQERNLNLIMLVTPISRYYRDYSLHEFKNSFYNLLEGISGVVHVLDLYEDERFNLYDYNDMDHLGASGAEKMTKILKAALEEIDG